MTQTRPVTARAGLRQCRPDPERVTRTRERAWEAADKATRWRCLAARLRRGGSAADSAAGALPPAGCIFRLVCGTHKQ